MLKKNDSSLLIRIASVLFILLSGWWLYLQINRSTDYSIQNQIFSSVYGILALFGGISGFWIAKKWGGFKSVMGKSITFFSFGLVGQFFGQLVYSFYVYFFKIEIPYPSYGDIGYFSTIIFYILGLLYLAKASGVIFKLKNLKHKIIAIFIPVIMLFFSYWLYLKGYQYDWKNPLKILLDFGYPLGDTVYIAVTLIIYFFSKGILGGIMKPKILFLLFALFIQFLADYSFLYITYYGNIYPGGINDFVYLLAYFLMTISLVQLLNAYHEIKKL